MLVELHEQRRDPIQRNTATQQRSGLIGKGGVGITAERDVNAVVNTVGVLRECARQHKRRRAVPVWDAAC